MKSLKLSGFSDEISPDIQVQFKTLNKLGIQYYEPRGVNGKNISELTHAEVADLCKTMKEFGIKSSSVGSPIGKFKLSGDFEKHFELFKKVIETALLLESRYVRIFSFFREGDAWNEKMHDTIFENLRRMIDYAKLNGVILLHENEKDIYGDTAGRCLELMKELSCENFKAVFDPANFIQCGEDTIKAYEKLKDYIAYVHIKDAVLCDGRVVPAGYGDGNIEYILEQLICGGYDGFLSLEPHLGNFQGLDELELSDIMKGLPESGEGTFTLAFNALEKILNKLSGGKYNG